MAMVFFIYWWVDHGGLPSFPTRRSSDLSGVVRSRPVLAPRIVRSRRGRPSKYPPTFTMRSEEHTSELQSRGHLVCRLLLEKKKTTKRLLPLRDQLPPRARH